MVEFWHFASFGTRPGDRMPFGFTAILSAWRVMQANAASERDQGLRFGQRVFPIAAVRQSVEHHVGLKVVLEKVWK
jgi:hypothetical protein